MLPLHPVTNIKNLGASLNRTVNLGFVSVEFHMLGNFFVEFSKLNDV